MITNLTLQPGESRTNIFVWDGHSAVATEMPLTARLPAGTYYATAEVLPFEGLLRTSITLELK